MFETICCGRELNPGDFFHREDDIPTVRRGQLNILNFLLFPLIEINNNE